MNVRVRFAPSPTGYLHIGGARTALFNWLYARHVGGKLILRIEDTDTARNTPEAVRVILDGLHWLGLDWDEGPSLGNPDETGIGEYGPYYQSQRADIYQRRIADLKEKGFAYDHEGAVRFRMRREATTFRDLVVGEVTRELTDREAADPDFVIVRSDGQPVFHLVNVVDDLEMGITHVIRGEDHLSNTPKHLALFEAFGAKPPHYAHIPLILNANGSKMSKRDEGASLATYLHGGYAPEAVVNYLCLLGWSPKDGQEILSLEEVVKRFDLPQILRHNARFDSDKFQWVNFEHLRSMPEDRYRALAASVFKKEGIDLSEQDRAYVTAALATCRDKVKSLTDLPGFVGFYFKEDFAYDPEAAQTQFTAENRPILDQLLERLNSLPSGVFTADAIQDVFKGLAEDLGVKVRVLVHPARLACTGSPVGPSLYHLMEVLDRGRVVSRLRRALDSYPAQ